ncbi:MAG: ribosomal L7Ae/L30e/S12e/Gadd45 family protein [Erysipelotrichaceae bacterium]|nr:ribosomal L7Ae/L30e/S12e/Gadd45 family protein [Erysipelotrichaceae bacterium]MDY5251336.1 ribosomal L7Ae/L30e/S12e/Gadd45 family protein [Erysipelotrichaceae bacterium]
MASKVFYQLLGLAYRAKKISFGDSAIDSVRNHQSHLVLITNDISARSQKKVEEKCRFYQVELMIIDDSQTLAMYLGKNNVKVISINDIGFAKSLKNK